MTRCNNEQAGMGDAQLWVVSVCVCMCGDEEEKQKLLDTMPKRERQHRQHANFHGGSLI